MEPGKPGNKGGEKDSALARKRGGGGKGARQALEQKKGGGGRVSRDGTKELRRKGEFKDWQPLDQGGAMGVSVARPTLSKVKSMTG
jgi:hypothetical protein